MGGSVTLPSSVVQLQALPSSSASTQSAPQIPPAIASLPNGANLNGFVVNRDAQNNPIIRTEGGDVLVRSEVFLRTGSEVNLRIERNLTNFEARLINVDGQSIRDVVQQQAQQGITARSDSVITTATTNPTSIQQATLLQPAPAANLAALPAPLQTLAQSLIEGSALNVRIFAGENALLNAPQTTTAATTTTTAATTAAAASLNPSIQSNIATQAPLTQAQINNAFSSYGTSAIPQNTANTQNIALPSAILTGNPAPQPPAFGSSNIAGLAFQNATVTANALQLPTQTLPASLVPLLGATLNSATAITANATAPATAGTVNPAAITTTAAATSVGGTALPSATPTATPTTTAPQIGVPNAPAAPPAPPPPTAAAQAAPSTASVSGAAVNIPPAFTAANPQQVTAQVVGIERSGATILNTPIGSFQIFPTTPLAVGSTVTLDLSLAFTPGSSPQTVTSVTQASAQTPSAWLALSRDWQSLSSLAALLPSISPGVAGQFNQNAFVQADKTLTKGMLFFLNALQGGAPSDWLGGGLFTHKDARVQELLKRISAEFNAMRPMASEQPDQPWQSAFIPLLHDNDAEQLRIFWRDYESESGAEQGKSGERFIVEATLSELGELQLDGLINKQNTPLHFDLAIRSSQPIDETMKEDIHEIFASAADVTGFVGQLRFSEKPEHMEHPLEEMVKARQQKVQETGIDSRSILA